LVDQQLVKFGENTARVADNLKENPPTTEINALLNKAKRQSSDAPKQPLRDRQIPHWQTILEMAAKLGDKTEFGYLGVDIVLDQQKGPLLLEITLVPEFQFKLPIEKGLFPDLKQLIVLCPNSQEFKKK
jgi:hypothetical protein